MDKKQREQEYDLAWNGMVKSERAKTEEQLELEYRKFKHFMQRFLKETK